MNTEWAIRGLCIKTFVSRSVANGNNNATGTLFPMTFFSGRDCWMKIASRGWNSGTGGRMNSLCKAFCCLHPRTDPSLHCFYLISWKTRWKTRLMHFVVILRVKDVRRKALNPRECWSQHGRLRSLTTERFLRGQKHETFWILVNSFSDNVNAVIVAGTR